VQKWKIEIAGPEKVRDLALSGVRHSLQTALDEARKELAETKEAIDQTKSKSVTLTALKRHATHMQGEVSQLEESLKRISAQEITREQTDAERLFGAGTQAN
jgi:hypothetical protein